jgi:hypothetical protein
MASFPKKINHLPPGVSPAGPEKNQQNASDHKNQLQTGKVKA